MKIRTALSSKPRGLIVAILAAGAMALTGCQGGGEPVVEPTSTSTVTSVARTPTPTPTAAYKPADASGKAQNVPVPVKPALADENSKEGLEAFTKYWFELLSYGYETGDTAEWSRLSSPSCAVCNDIRESIAVSYKLDRWQVGGQMSTPSITADMENGSGSSEVVVQTIQEASAFYLADGRVGREPEPETNSATLLIANFNENAWIISDLHALK